MSTKEGYHWLPSTGLQPGLPTDAVQPSTHSPASSYDIIVIGAGYAGLTAARDLAIRNHSVLLLDARDRIGGRTWTADIDGFKYEMGGTWIQWKQPHVYAEVSRYGLQDQLAYTPDYGGGVNTFSMKGSVDREMSHEEEAKLFASAVSKFFNVDGEMGRKVIPFPHWPFKNEVEVRRWDGISARERIEQVRREVGWTEEEEVLIASLAVHMSGGSLENTGFWDLLRWWALCEYRPEGIMDYGLSIKLKCGQTRLAKHMFDDAMETGNLNVLFESPVRMVKDDGSTVTVESDKGTFQANKVVCALPLNVLYETKFEPALSTAKIEASRKGHVDMAAKIHYEVKGPELKSWSGLAWPGQGLIYAYGDGVTPAGNTHLTAFGCSMPIFNGEDDLEKTKKAMLEIRDVDILRIVLHNWVTDAYARGAWCMFDTGVASKYVPALQEKHGNVEFASADSADGWRGFIDGAIEQGARTALSIAKSLRQSKKNGETNGVV